MFPKKGCLFFIHSMTRQKWQVDAALQINRIFWSFSRILRFIVVKDGLCCIYINLYCHLYWQVWERKKSETAQKFLLMSLYFAISNFHPTTRQKTCWCGQSKHTEVGIYKRKILRKTERKRAFDQEKKKENTHSTKKKSKIQEKKK